MRNSIDGVTYRGSVIETRKYVNFITDDFLSKHFEGESVPVLENIGITTEAAIGKSGSLLSVFFPAFVVGYCSNLPPDLDHKAFCRFLEELLAVSNIGDICRMEENPIPSELCEQAGVWQRTGFRYHLWNRRQLPHLFLVDRSLSKI